MHEMYSKLPNLVLGFHGCDQEVFDRVVKNGEPILPSANDYDWLGTGVYFWEQNCERALQWAEESNRVVSPAVIGAVIDLGNCLNLTDSYHIGLVEEEYQLLKRDFELIGKELPENTYKSDLLLRRLDCAVLQHLFERTDHEYKIGVETVGPFDSARGLFSEGERIYPNAGFKKKTHVQICVRNPNCIKGYFNPMQRDSGWPIP